MSTLHAGDNRIHLLVRRTSEAKEALQRLRVQCYSGKKIDSIPKGPSSPNLWFLVPIKAPESLNNEYLDP